MPNQFLEFFNYCQQQNAQNQKVILATIVHTQGSTYQKAGARMILSSDGSCNGILAGGCFEADLMEQAQDVLKTGKSKSVYYDMRSADDVIWGLGLGCDGAVRILLQLLDPKNNFEPLYSFVHAAEKRSCLYLVSIITSHHKTLTAGKTLTWCGPEKPQDDLLSKIIDSKYFDLIKQQKTVFEEVVIDSQRVRLFMQKLLPPRQILLLGAGPDVIPLATLASVLRWHVTIADHRLAKLNPAQFPQSVQLVEVTPETIHKDLSLEQFDGMILMTHSYDYDLRYLKTLAHSSIPYIGLLGPTHRRDRLYNDLQELADKIKSRSHGPVGVAIGSKTPEEISLSILAELQAVYSGQSGGLLDKRPIEYQCLK